MICMGWHLESEEVEEVGEVEGVIAKAVLYDIGDDASVDKREAFYLI